MDELMQRAIHRTNDKLSCEADPVRTRRVFARLLHNETARGVRVAHRGMLAQFGFDAYSAWIESGTLPRREFIDRSDVFGRVSASDSVVLRAVGVCSTVRINDTLLGTDKLDHFLDLGYTYAKSSNWGRRPERAVQLGTRTELRGLGLWTSMVFSYADLRANWDGYLFYRDLFQLHSPIALGADGCVGQRRPWGWSEWIDDEYDEVLNPSVHTDRVQARLWERLRDDPAKYCEAAGDIVAGHTAHLESLFSERPVYVGPGSPTREDPFSLGALCVERGSGRTKDEDSD